MLKNQAEGYTIAPRLYQMKDFCTGKQGDLRIKIILGSAVARPAFAHWVVDTLRSYHISSDRCNTPR